MIEIERVDIDTRILDRFAAMNDMAVDQALRATAEQVEGLAKDRAPVDTGALKGSIHTAKAGDMEYAIADGVEYGIYQELGTHKMAAHPFLVPALKKAIEQLYESVRKEYDRIMR